MKNKNNPVNKLIALIIGAILVFLIDSLVLLLPYILVLIFLKQRYRVKGRFGKTIIFLVIAILVAQIVFVPKGNTIFELYFIEITLGSVKTGLLISGRFFSLITMSWIFVGTTEPRDLASGLANIGMPYRYSFLLILAMKFAPVFQQELSTVQQAQKIRGLKIDKSLDGLIRSIRYTTIPLLFSSLSKVNNLASSMEGRGFGHYKKKTFLHPIKFTKKDYFYLILMLVSSVFIVYMNNFIL